MKRLILSILLASPLALSSAAFQAQLDPSKELGLISDLAYGSNQPMNAKTRLKRHGGNRFTGYNWEINASNAGNDYKHMSDNWLNSTGGLPQEKLGPAALPIALVGQDRAAGRYSVLTVPMAGFVVADASGEVATHEKAPSRRWVKVAAKKDKPFAPEPDLKDGTVYVDEFVDYIKRKGSLAAFYCLDNEPGLWDSTHPRIHPRPASYDEMAEKSVATAAAILDVAPNCRIAGAVTYGWNEIRKLQNAPDSGKYNPSYGAYINFYLAKMKEASDKQGRRLLHLLDNHWYPEARGGGKRITEGKDHSNKALVMARLQAPRSLWDPEYEEDSWITKDAKSGPIRLIPRIKEAIDKYYPGTQPAFLEWNYGGGDHISGGLAAADVLGIYGRYGAAACFWQVEDKIPFTEAAYKLYLDFDGKGARFGDTSLDIATPDKERLSLHAAKDSKNPKRVTLVAVHKDMVNAGDLKVSFKGAAGGKMRAYRLEGKTPSLKESLTAGFSAAGLADKLPPMSATVYEIVLK